MQYLYLYEVQIGGCLQQKQDYQALKYYQCAIIITTGKFR